MRSKTIATATIVIALTLSAFIALPGRTSAQAVPHGPWVDQLFWSEQPDAAIALEQIKADNADFFMFSLQGGAQKEDAFQSPNVLTSSTFGSVNGLLFNPNDQQPGLPWNPFTDALLREAMQWLIDREFLGLEVLDGFAASFYGPFHPKAADTVRELTLYNQLADTYKADFTKAEATINARMAANGATIGGSGFWEDSSGNVIDLQIIARIEDERLDIGNYVAEQLEDVGFMVTVNPSPSSDAIPLVYAGPPDIGAWHIYTEGWAFTANVGWNDGMIFDYHACSWEPFCTPDRGGGAAGTFEVSQATYDMAQGLATGQYTSLAERQSWIQTLMPLGFTEGNYRMWIQAEEAVFPVNDRVEGVVMDGFGGPWTYFTLKSAKLLTGEAGVDPVTGVGGDVRVLNLIAFNDNWNPWQFDTWLYDGIQRRAIYDSCMWLHPQAGEWMDYRCNTSVETAGPTGTMAVPSTAQVWNVTRATYPGGSITSQGFVDVGSGVTAVSKVTVDYEPFGSWHTGQALTIDDVIYSISLAYRRAIGDVFDHDPLAASTSLKFFLSDILKGIEFVDDHTIAFYIDFWHVSETQIAAAGYLYLGTDGLGDAGVPWEIQEASVRTVLNDQSAIRDTTAEAKGVPSLDLARNPSTIALVDTAFASLTSANTIPVGMSSWITSAEATARYAASQDFRDTYEHWYASQGPFILRSLDPTFRQTVMTAFREGYPFEAGHFDALAAREVPDVAFGSFPTTLLAGTGATLPFATTIEGDPVDPKASRWFVRNVGTGVIPLAGAATRVGIGEYEVQLFSTLTVGLETGAYELVVVVSGTGASEVRSYAFTVTSQLDFFSALIDELENRIDTLTDTTSGLDDSVQGVQGSTNNLQTLVLGVLILAIIAIVVPVVLSLLILRRIPPGG